jgi:hypothetical protein
MVRLSALPWSSEMKDELQKAIGLDWAGYEATSYLIKKLNHMTSGILVPKVSNCKNHVISLGLKAIRQYIFAILSSAWQERDVPRKWARLRLKHFQYQNFIAEEFGITVVWSI